MAHGIMDTDSMFSGMGIVPWHGLGKVVDGALTAEEAIEAAGLGWNVVKRPMFVPGPEGDDNYYPIDGHYAIVRGDTGGVLGVTKGRYMPLQNREAFGFFDNIVAKQEAIFHTAGSLFDGKRIWIMAKLPGEIVVKGQDITEKFLLLTNGHDGQSVTEVKFTSVRVVCQNTLKMALKEAGNTIRIRHTQSMHDKLAQAVQLMGITNRYYDSLNDRIQALAKKELSASQVSGYLDDVYGDQERAKEAILELVETGMGTDIPGVRGTAWGAYNAVTEYTNHHARYKNDNIKWDNLWFKRSAEISERAFDLALAL